MLLTNEHSLIYNQIIALPSILRRELQLLFKCCVFKFRQYIYSILQSATLNDLEEMFEGFPTETVLLCL